MAEAGNITQQLLDVLSRYTGFEDVPGTGIKATEDVEQVQGLFDGWYYKWIKRKERTWPAEVVLHRLNFLCTKYIETVTNRDTQPRTVRRVERISEVCRILHEVRRQGRGVHVVDGSVDGRSDSHEDDIERTLNGVGGDTVLGEQDDGVSREKERAGGRETSELSLQGAGGQPGLGGEPNTGATEEERAVIAALEAQIHSLTQEMGLINSSAGIAAIIAEQPDLHELFRREIQRIRGPDAVVSTSVGTQ